MQYYHKNLKLEKSLNMVLFPELTSVYVCNVIINNI
jgi:hypothetical protein